MKNKKILLVGGSGFIGHNLALKLKKEGAVPTIVDSLAVNNILSTDNNEFHNKNLYNSILQSRLDLLKMNNIKLIIQDARDYDAISRSIKSSLITNIAELSKFSLEELLKRRYERLLKIGA